MRFRCDQAADEEDCIGALEWSMGYHRRGPLFADRFFTRPRRIGLYAWLFDPDLPAGRARRVFEMQL